MRARLASLLVLTGVAVAAVATLSLRPRAVPTRVVRVVPTPLPSPAPTPLVVRRVLPIGPIRFGEHHWDEAGVPAGPIVITVDLEAQVLSVFRGGHEIGAAAIMHGDGDKPTPLGRFPITEKDADHVSNLYGAPMPYMLRLTNDGISVHGAEVSWDRATHGCIGVPVAFARKLFAVAKLGDVVIVTRGRMIGMGKPLLG